MRISLVGIVGLLGTIALGAFVLIKLAIKYGPSYGTSPTTAPAATQTTTAPKSKKRGWLVWVGILILLVTLGVLVRHQDEVIGFFARGSATTPETAKFPMTASQPTPFDQIIEKAAATYGVDPALVKAMIRHESGFDPRRVSPKGAKGLMQLMPGTQKKYGVTDAFNPAQNIDAGTHYLSDLLKRYNGNTELALAAYNAGETAVDDLTKVRGASWPAIASALPGETQGYVPAVMATLTGYRQGSAQLPFTVHVPLLGEDRLSEVSVQVDRVAPPAWYWHFWGPGTAKAHFDDGTIGPITKDFGVRGGTVRFSGPAGEEVTVRFTPPG